MTRCEPEPEDDDDRDVMTYGERNTWMYAVLIPVTSIAYFVVVIPRLFDQPASEVSWVAPMLWAIGASIVGSIIGSIVSAIVTRDEKAEEDVRDKQIDRYGDGIAQAITGFGAAAVLALTMFEVDHFWIASSIFLMGAVGSTWGAIAKIRAYRGAFHG